MKFVTNVNILGLERGAPFEADLTEYLATLVRSEMISVGISALAAAPAPVDSGPVTMTSPAPRKRASAPRKRASGTGTRKRAAKKAGGSSDGE